MITPINAIKAWLEADPLWASYQFSLARGFWRDSPTNATKRIAQIAMTGGAAPIADVSRNTASLILLGPQKGTADAPAIEEIAEKIRQRLFTDYKACGVAQIRLVGGIIGPGYTAEDRPWYELNLEILT
ncbi:hypothetical protein D3C77_106060 [compost metagenome]